MDESRLQLIENKVAELNSSHAPWVIPILRAIRELGGEAKPKDVRASIKKLVAGILSDAQWAHVVRSNRLGWVRFELVQKGLISGERSGVWALTEDGTLFIDAHNGDQIAFDDELPGDEDAIVNETEMVQVTNYPGYEIPLLRCLADGPLQKQVLMERLVEAIRGHLLPGDFRRMENGEPVWLYRASWALTNLKKSGELRNPGWGLWEITETGQKRFLAESDRWQATVYQSSRATVVAQSGAGTGGKIDKPPAASWSIDHWNQLGRRVGKRIWDALDKRLRPNLLPTPALKKSYISRNVILYGPPGTGKTHVALAIAQALTGESDPGPDSRMRVVQFHPSYAYSDWLSSITSG